MQTLLIVMGILAAGAGAVALFQRDWSKNWSDGAGGGGPFSAIDEVFAPTRHEAQQELKEQYDRTAPAPVPSDPNWFDVDLDAGTVTLSDPDRSDNE